MTFKDELLKKREQSSNAPYVLFVNRYKPDTAINYVFVESNDDTNFYSLCVERLGDFVCSFIPCNGKSLVMKMRSRLSSGIYDHSRIHYIIDADHDRFLTEAVARLNNVFVTDHYSVESYLCCPIVFTLLLRQFAVLDGSDPALVKARALFLELQTQFEREMLIPMATAIVLRRIGGSDSLHFDGIELHDFLRLSAKGVIAIGSLESAIVKAWTGVANCSYDFRVRRLSQALVKRDARSWIRGKYYSWWYVRVFNVIARFLSENEKDMNGNSIVCTLKNLGQSQFISVCKMHSVCPKNFEAFVRRRFVRARRAAGG
ncbi:MAG: DUF4435 domain-containing protein [Hyphomicrobiales bacterium]|nr:MAG: DUF4435 domain-containing protein [Hyphomicrobiales bacterium]